MKIGIEVNQQEAIKTGSEKWGWVWEDISLSMFNDEEREELSVLNEKKDVISGDHFFAITKELHNCPENCRTSYLKFPNFSKFSLENCKELLSLRINSRKQIMEQHEIEESKKRDKAKNCDISELFYYHNLLIKDELYKYAPEREIEALAAISSLSEKRIKEREESERRKIEERERITKETQEKEARDKQRLDKWVSTYCSEIQQKKYKEGYLSEDEIKNTVRNAIFIDLNFFPRYKRLKSSDFEFPDSVSIGFSVEESSVLTDDEYCQLEKIRSKLPENATVTPRNHRGESDTEILEKVGFLVSIELDGETLTREYGM